MCLTYFIRYFSSYLMLHITIQCKTAYKILQNDLKHLITPLTPLGAEFQKTISRTLHVILHVPNVCQGVEF